MTLTTKTVMRNRAIAFLVALVLMFSMLCVMGVPAFAASSTPVPSADPDSLFGFVGNDGSINTNGHTIQNGNNGDRFATVISQYRTIATAIMGVLTITMIIFMLIQITKLGASGDNEMARKKAIMGILTTGIATALLGGVTIVIGFFWNVLQ